MHPITTMYPQLPTIPVDFVELNRLFHIYVTRSLDELHHKLTQFIQQKKSSNAAQQAARAIQLELQQNTSQAQAHWIEAERDTSSPLFLKCLQIETLIQTAQFSAINQIIKTLPVIRHTTEPEALLYLAHTAVICGLPSIAMRLVPILPESQHRDDLVWTIKVLREIHTQEAQLESQFIAAKDWLIQQGIIIVCCGSMYSIIDDWLFDLVIYINEPDIAKLAHINIALDNYLLDTFPTKLPASICVHIHSIQELN